MAIFHCYVSSPEGKHPFSLWFSYHFPIKASIFLWFSTKNNIPTPDPSRFLRPKPTTDYATPPVALCCAPRALRCARPPWTPPTSPRDGGCIAPHHCEAGVPPGPVGNVYMRLNICTYVCIYVSKLYIYIYINMCIIAKIYIYIYLYCILSSYIDMQVIYNYGYVTWKKI